MNQTKKRLTIINLAISMTDIETIQLQVLKLALLKSDIKIGEILSTLNEKNYAQAQRLIYEYIDTPNETILQRTTQEDIQHSEISQKDEEQAIIEEFDLFTTPSHEISENFQEEVNYDSLLNVKANDILPNNISVDVSQNIQTSIETENIQEETIQLENTLIDNDNTNILPEENHTLQEHTTPKNDRERESSLSYEAIPNISTKFDNLYNQYPPIEFTTNRYNSVESWLVQVSTKEYTEADVEARIKDGEELQHTNLEESAQFLIAAASTESLYALFRLARALFTGNILQKNISEAVTLIHHLAIDKSYPEAICDIAQLFEHGVEVKKDKEQAETLYKEAMDLGIQRASKHYERIHKENKSHFAKFQK